MTGDARTGARAGQAARIAALGALAAAAALALAYASEHWGGLAPCQLCLWQRWPYWAAIPLGLAALALPRLARPLAVLVALLFLGNAALAAFHAGVEWKLWPSPFPGCGAGGAGPAASIEELMARIAAAPIVRCDEPAIVIAGLSPVTFRRGRCWRA
ncbi:MAG: disulfide bond formation protein B [Rubritepida sp.]|nr:disulfide bond formation protein B [Rubritepida sp.]